MILGRPHCLKRCPAFTLMEMVITMVVIGILAGFAVPIYNKVVERSKKSEAYTIIGLTRAGFKARLFANETIDAGVWNPSGCDNGNNSDQSWAGLGMVNPNCDPTKLFFYDVWDPTFSSTYAPVNAARYVVIAVRKTGGTMWDGIAAGKWLYMDLNTGDVFASDYYK